MKTHFFLRGALLALACVLGLRADDAADRLKALADWQAGRVGGVALAYVSPEGVTFAAAGRFASDDPRAIDPDTLFEIGSVTKVFTALLLADAIQAGKVQLDDPVGAPFAESKVTYRQLVTHTSGLPALPPDFSSSDPGDPYAAAGLPALMASFSAIAPQARPSVWAYSNFGFAVLGQAVAGAWGEPWPVLIKRRVLVPLSLNDTFVSWHDVDSKRLSPGHDAHGRAKNWSFDAYAPAGSLVSSARELARFLQANLGFVETPLAVELADAAKPLTTVNPRRRIGLAWMIEKQGPLEITWHNGITRGYRSFIAFDRARKIGVALLSNHERELEPLGFALITGKLLPESATSTAAPAESLQPLLGNYPLTPSFILTISAEGEQLLVQGTGQPRLKLRPVSTNRYAAEGVPAEITFERAADGSVTALVLHQNGLDQRAPRLAPGTMPEEPKEMAMTAEELGEYVGKYRLAPGPEFTFTQQGARLFAQLTGQPATQVFAEKKDRFFYKVVNAQLTFERDRAGKVVAVILHQHGLDQRAPKLE